MDTINIYWFLCGVVISEIITGFIIISTLHKRWYGSYIIKLKNLPITKKIKERLNLEDDFIL